METAVIAEACSIVFMEDGIVFNRKLPNQQAERQAFRRQYQNGCFTSGGINKILIKFIYKQNASK